MNFKRSFLSVVIMTVTFSSLSSWAATVNYDNELAITECKNSQVKALSVQNIKISSNVDSESPISKKEKIETQDR